MKQEHIELGPLCHSHTWRRSAASSRTTAKQYSCSHRNISPLSRLQPASVRRTVGSSERVHLMTPNY